MKTIDIKGKPYVTVAERIKYFRENFADWSLETEIVELTDNRCVIKGVVRDPNGVVKASGTAYELASSSYINKTSYIENCETSAWGRALGNLGIGIDASIASAEEMVNAFNQQDKKKGSKENPIVPFTDPPGPPPVATGDQLMKIDNAIMQLSELSGTPAKDIIEHYVQKYGTMQYYTPQVANDVYAELSRNITKYLK